MVPTDKLCSIGNINMVECYLSRSFVKNYDLRGASLIGKYAKQDFQKIRNDNGQNAIVCKFTI